MERPETSYADISTPDKSEEVISLLDEYIDYLEEQLEKERERCKELEEENEQQADLFENMILGTSNCPKCCPKCGCNKITSDGSKAWCLNEKCDFVTLDC